ncbi:S-phase kinase-associated protein 1A [Culex quinquefasciatus]|uniref:S-phase kinase-associated protein 1A n=1 Tax=Culex quinquefasciatus TaxID=7176 RepID=B0W409_CULQU|nr:S-phase kinase-associated protein 1A [Culex quinquefasciatus]|eukprot:XP_001843443.1 S-phase kinase-associated protein 1A [Culex quinquefasciatus]
MRPRRSGPTISARGTPIFSRWTRERCLRLFGRRIIWILRDCSM